MKKLMHMLGNYRGGEVLPYMGDIGMCCCEGYGFQEVYSRIGYIRAHTVGNYAPLIIKI